MASSEAIMVAPEQCATAPKQLAAKQMAAQPAARTSTTRLVLLAVLALAAATGAMFGVVVFGNEFTKDMHPKKGASNGVTLVDSEDRAVATADVESYVSLLDLPLLGTAELNKVDGITFSTYKGVEHRKVTGYTVTKETASVGDSEVHTPRLSLATSAPGETIEISVRDNKAWLSEADGLKNAAVAIDLTSQRRLADGGSCLENGACLYSRDELLRLDAETRRLEEGSFFARADVAAYQVELSGDVMQYLEGDRESAALLEGTYLDAGHRVELRIEQLPTGTRMLYTNATTGKARLVTSEGSFLFVDDKLVECNVMADTSAVSSLDVDAVAKVLDFETVATSRGTSAKLIPYEATREECVSLVTKQANMSTPEALALFPAVAKVFQTTDVKSAKNDFKKGARADGRRRLEGVRAEARDNSKIQEIVGLMTNPLSGRHVSKDDLLHPDPKRRLSAVRAKRGLYASGRTDTKKYGSGLSYFDLWIAARLANPTHLFSATLDSDYTSDSDMDATAMAQAIGAEPILDLAGVYGVREMFSEWTGYHYYDMNAPPSDASGNLAYACTADRRRLEVMQEEASRRLQWQFGSGAGSGGTGVIKDDLYASTVPPSAAVCATSGKCSGKELKYIDDVLTSQIALQATFKGSCAGGIVEGGAELPPSIVSDICDTNYDSFVVADSAFTAATGNVASDLASSLAQCQLLIFAGADREAQVPADCRMIQACIYQWAKANDPFISNSDAFDMCVGMIDGHRRLGAELPEDMPENVRKLFGLSGPALLQPVAPIGISELKTTVSSSNFQLELGDEEENSAPMLISTSYTAPQLMLTSTCTSKVSAACGRRRLATESGRQLSGSGFAAPTAWGSVIFKKPIGTLASDYEYVVTFQGTEMDEPSMIPYIIEQDPVLISYTSETGTGTVFPSTAFTAEIIIQQGYAMYMQQVIPCIDKMVASLDSASIAPAYIVGHSLGGATATAYSQFLAAGPLEFGADTFLVTFGSPPTLWKAGLKGSRAPIYFKMSVKSGGAPQPYNGWKAVYALNSIVTDSVRFFHKFDPVPSSLFYGNVWAHQTNEAVMLFDYPTSDCKRPSPTCYTGVKVTGQDVKTLARGSTGWKYDTAFKNQMTKTENNIQKLLCDEYDVIPSAKVFRSSDAYTYYSYMNMFNPMPCAEVILSAMYKALIANGIYVIQGKEPWVPLETFFECTMTYIGTIKAYGTAFLASDLEDFRGGKDWENNYLEHVVFTLAWGLMFVHMTYPFYPMCGEYGEVDGIKPGMDKNPINTFMDTIKESLPGFSAGPVGSGYGFGPYDYQSGAGVSDPSDALEKFWEAQF